MKVETLFSTPIFHNFFNLDLKDLEDLAYRLQGQSEGRKKSNVLGWQSNDIQEEEEVQNLIFEVNNQLKELHEYCRFKSDTQLVLNNMWININKKYSYNQNHIHSDSFFSGVFYVKVPEKSGFINFENPSSLQKVFMQQYKHFLNNLNEFTAESWTYSPHPNMMVLFPSWIEHNVDQNLSDSDRISIAFNTRLLY